MLVTDADEERLVKIGYRLHLKRKMHCKCDRDDCEQCTTQFLFDVLKRVVVLHNNPRAAGHNGGPILTRL